MTSFYRLSLLIFFAVLCVLNAPAQGFAPAETPDTSGTPAPGVVEEEKVDQRINRLEAELKLMKEQIEALRKLLDRRETAMPQSVIAQNTNEAADPRSAVTGSTPDPATAEQKKDLSFDAGDYRITPYGIIFFNAFSNSGGTNNADDPLWAAPGARGNASASGRQTRLGVRFEGGKLGNANVKGVVEADFYGGFPAVGIGEHMGVVRLRLANVRLDWERTSVIVGQDWMIFAPNSPTSLAAQAIPQFASAGNPWARLPQVRVEQQLGNGFKWQGA
ncbi:MAG: hypothetical protein OEQ28_13455, partial [Acidobacteriota bacterium]|nr:hypothetical protein [Acidobacteriota bacterium]